MKLFRWVEQAPERVLAVDDAGNHIQYGDVAKTGALLGKIVGRNLIFILCENNLGTLAGYLGCLYYGAVPLLLDTKITKEQLNSLVRTYNPAFLLAPSHCAIDETAKKRECILDSVLYETGYVGPTINSELALLLTTSGSTGSPRLVRLSRRNLDSNACSIAQYLKLDETQRPITLLPMAYSYGMSIINSHILVGATIHVTKRDVMEEDFWNRVQQDAITSLPGVPYTYQMYERVGLMDRALPALKTLTQAGGKLPDERNRRFAQWALETGRDFYVMYGQTEASPRMSYLPPEWSVTKCGSIGIPIPGGKFHIEDENGNTITDLGEPGELVYHGDNVAMGYAEKKADLELGDVWKGVLHTGDMARCDKDGLYFIVGRKKRFIKILGNRINLDELEQLLSSHFPSASFACSGQDEQAVIFTDIDDESLFREASTYLAAQTHLKSGYFHVHYLEKFPRNESGKLRYEILNDLARARLTVDS